jgi:hypothetical protein
MKLLTGLLLLLCTTALFSQSVTSDYFEVFTKLAHRPGSSYGFNRDSILPRISSLADTAGRYATFAITVNDPSQIDSLIFTLTNSQEQLVHTSANPIASLQSNPAFQITGNTLYYKVGPFPYLHRFSATARVRGNDGQSTPIQSFAKN